MRGRLVESWEIKLKRLFDEIDDELEERFGSLYDLHPSRAKRGATSNKEQDGLFDIGASFSAGFGSESGRGYVLDVDMITLEHVPKEVQAHIEALVVEKIREKLPRFFPGKDLRVSRDGNVFKIIGDLSFST
jgi:hypothetical protein